MRTGQDDSKFGFTLSLGLADEALTASVDRWLAAFDRALAASDMTALAALIHPDGHWRDLVALTWNIGTVSGGREIAAALVRSAADAKPSSFRTDGTRTPPGVSSICTDSTREPESG